MSIAVAANCVRPDCQQPAVRMIHCSPAGLYAGFSESRNGGSFLLTYRCSVCGHTWAVTRHAPLEDGVVARSAPVAQRVR